MAGCKKFFRMYNGKPTYGYKSAECLLAAEFGDVVVCNNRGRVLAEFWL